MELTSSQMEIIRYQFESYCKRLLRNEKNYYVRKMRRIAEHETNLKEVDKLYTMDEYPVEYFQFSVDGETVEVRNELLANALTSLPSEKRDTVLLAYWLGKTDAEIAQRVNRAKSTVQYQRTRTLEKLKKYMGGKTDEEM